MGRHDGLCHDGIEGVEPVAGGDAAVIVGEVAGVVREVLALYAKKKNKQKKRK